MRFFALLCLFCISLPSLAQSVLPTAAAEMLMSEEGGARKVGAKVIYHERIKDPLVLDILALQIPVDMERAGSDDLVAWELKALTKAGLKRYSNFLQSLNSAGKSEKVLSYLAKAREAAVKGDDEPFVIEENTRAKLLSALAERWESFKGQGEEAALTEGNFAEKVFVKMGKPDRLSDEVVYVRRPYVGSIPTQRLVVHYEGKDTFRMGYAGREFIIERIYRVLPYDPSLFDSEEMRQNAKLVATGMPSEFLSAARKIYRTQEANEALLDLMATRVWVERYSEDGVALDGAAWLLKGIGLSTNPRYKYILTHLSKSKRVSGKIRKYAKRALKQLVDMDAEQFRVES